MSGMGERRGKVAVLTGAASGIGRGLAERLARDGMRLVLADVEAAPLEELAAGLRQGGAEVITQVGDMSRADDVEAVHRRAVETFGAVHLLSTNAGVSAHGPVWTIDEATWGWVIGVNLVGTIHAVRTFVPDLVAQDDGYVLLTASMQGLTVPAGAAPYTVTKFGVVALAEVLHHDLRAAGSSVGVSVLCPGPIATRIGTSARNRPDGRGSAEAAAATVPVHPQSWSPAAFADLVVRCMEEERFYVLTHPDYEVDVDRRHAAIKDSRAPALLPPLAQRTFSEVAPELRP